MTAWITARSAVSVALGIVRALPALFGRYVPDVQPLRFDALETARWREMVEAATVVRASAAQDPSERVAWPFEQAPERGTA